MKRKNAGNALFIRTLAWILLVVFALTLAGFSIHTCRCHSHAVTPADADEPCPFCEAFSRCTRLLLPAGLTAALLYILNVTGSQSLLYNPELPVRETPVNLRVKMLD